MALLAGVASVEDVFPLKTPSISHSRKRQKIKAIRFEATRAILAIQSILNSWFPTKSIEIIEWIIDDSILQIILYRLLKLDDDTVDSSWPSL